MAKEYFIKGKSIDDLLKNNPGQVPIILTKHIGSDVPELSKKKYLVTKDITLSQFTYFLRKMIKLNSSDAIFIFTKDKTLLTGQSKIETVYDKYKDPDHILYITYSAENVFG